MTILVCGEALFDLIQSQDEPPLQFDARIGGSPFNVAVGLAKLGTSSAFYGGVSEDSFGVRIAAHLAAEGVDPRYIIRSPRPTTLSLVALDADGAPAYAFYGENTADAALTPDRLPQLGPDISALHFGSYSIVASPAADTLAELARQNRNRFISLDPNIRPTIEPDMTVWRRRIDDHRRHANMIKISAEDLAHLYPAAAAIDIARAWAQDGAELVVVTDGGRGVLAIAGEAAFSVTPPTVTLVDTIGAGDSFQAALLSELCRFGGGQPKIAGAPPAELEAALAFAAHAASTTCGRRGADLPRRSDLLA
ncbi:MAG: carbohydrate kinase [Neomegalonema sp.]|nr:carbohydrate kinase [Neomegalonema sp.]